MSRQNPCTNTTVRSSGPSRVSSTSTCRSTPSGLVTVSSASNGRVPNGSPASASSWRSERRTSIRSAATPAATPAAATPTIAPKIPARRAVCLANRLPPPVVHPRHPWAAEPRHDLVVDRVADGCPVVRGRLSAVAGPEQHGNVAGRHRVVAAVQDHLIHAYPTGDPPNLAAEGDRAAVAGDAGHAVGVAERDDGQSGIGAGVVGVAVGNALPGRYPFGE